MGRPKGKNRAEVVLAVVATDNTFYGFYNDYDRGRRTDASLSGWHGKCIHCGASVYVDRSGGTEATLEHIRPLCDGGDPIDPHNLALACVRCNNEKGVRHDRHAGKGGRADEVIAALQERRRSRWRDPVQVVVTSV